MWCTWHVFRVWNDVGYYLLACVAVVRACMNILRCMAVVWLDKVLYSGCSIDVTYLQLHRKSVKGSSTS